MRSTTKHKDESTGRFRAGFGFGFGCRSVYLYPTDTCNMLPRMSLIQRRVWSHLCGLFYSFHVYMGPLRPPCVCVPPARLRDSGAHATLRPCFANGNAVYALEPFLHSGCNVLHISSRCTCVAPCTGPVAGLERARVRRVRFVVDNDRGLHAKSRDQSQTVHLYLDPGFLWCSVPVYRSGSRRLPRPRAAAIARQTSLNG